MDTSKAEDLLWRAPIGRSRNAAHSKALSEGCQNPAAVDDRQQLHHCTTSPLLHVFPATSLSDHLSLRLDGLHAVRLRLWAPAACLG